MALNIPSPDFLARGVQTPDILGAQERKAQLSGMLAQMALQKQLAPLQVQEQQQKVIGEQQTNEIQKITLQGQRALSDWLQNGDANQDVPAGQFSSNDKIATFVGVSPNDPIMSVVRSMAQHHVPAPMLMAEAKGMLDRRTEYFKGTKEEQDAQKAERLVWQDALASLHEMPEDQRSVGLAAKLPLLEENSKTDPLLGAYAKGLAGHPELIDRAYNTLSAENAALGLRKAKAEAAKAQQDLEQNKINPVTGMSPQQQAEAVKQVSVETNPAVLHAKEEVAGVEARIRQQIEGMAKPVYALDATTGKRVPVSQTEALASPKRYSLLTPTTEAQMKEDTQLNNRLADVAQKIQRYRDTLTTPLSADDIAKMSAVIDPQNKLKLGISHTELPIDSFNQVFQSSLQNNLSPAAQKRLIAFRNAREAMTGYTRVLTGSGRSSDTSLELNEAALPHPLSSPEFADESMNQFGENLKIAAQGLPDMSKFGVKSPDDVVKSMSKGNSGGPQKGDIKNYQGHDYEFDGTKWVRK